MIRFRNISSLKLLFLGLLILIACENEKKIFEGPYFVRFTDTALTQKESHIPPVELQVHFGGPAPKEDVTITYTISGSAREGTDYVINGTRGKVKIKAGEYFGNIEVQLINNSNNILRTQDLVITLLTIDEGGIQVGQGVSSIGNKFTLTIQDDCILGGDYYGLKEGSEVQVKGITITSLDCETYTLSNWNVEAISLSERQLFFYDNADNTLTIPPQKRSSDPDTLAIDGTGVVNPVTREISFTVRWPLRTGQPTYPFKLIPN